MNEKQKEILDKIFNVYDSTDDKYIELEAWTDGGVDMIIDIDKNKDIIDELETYIDNFDIDEEIELYREDKRYKDAFTIRESLNDFESWLSYIEQIKNELKEVK